MELLGLNGTYIIGKDVSGIIFGCVNVMTFGNALWLVTKICRYIIDGSTAFDNVAAGGFTEKMRINIFVQVGTFSNPFDGHVNSVPAKVFGFITS